MSGQPPNPWKDPRSPMFAPTSWAGVTPPQAQVKRLADWKQDRIPLTWTAGVAPSFRNARWSTPTFDFYPHLQTAHGQGPGNTLPVWDMYARVHIQLFGLLTADMHKSLRVTAREYTSPTYPHNLALTLDPEDISAELVSVVRDSATLTAAPPGSGRPIRYWRYELNFDMYTDALPDPVIGLDAALY